MTGEAPLDLDEHQEWLSKTKKEERDNLEVILERYYSKWIEACEPPGLDEVVQLLKVHKEEVRYED